MVGKLADLTSVLGVKVGLFEYSYIVCYVLKIG